MKQYQEEGVKRKHKKRKQSSSGYYPGMVAEAITGIPGDLSSVSEINDFLNKKRKGGDENNVAAPFTKEKKQQKHKDKSDRNTTPQSEHEHKSSAGEKLSANISRSETKDKIRKFGSEEDRDRCTVFVGNLPNTVTKKEIIKYFRKFGSIVNTRLRCAAVSDPRIPKKVSVIKKNFHKDRSNIHAFICFNDENSANHALEANGDLFDGHHLRVDLASQKEHENKKAVFIGNLAFSAEEDALWKLFENCGPIDSIRIVRDQRTGMGKGFGYVNFKSKDSVELAIQLNGEIIKERPIRVSRCGNVKRPNKKPDTNTKPKIKPRTKKEKWSTADSTNYVDKKSRSENQTMGNRHGTKPDVKKTTNSFEDYQGRTALARKKKKKKVSKHVVKKKRITQQLNSAYGFKQKLKQRSES